jgi:GMP synthase-like glutamine amidotransferase
MFNEEQMKIGILQCDDVAPVLQERHGNYPDMFIRLFHSVDPDLSFEVWRCHEGELPSLDADVNAWIITGSKYGVNDGEPWIEALSERTRQLAEHAQPVIGICFGHQLLAHAMGGKVMRHRGGWGVGVSFTKVQQSKLWMTPWKDNLDLIVSHQDQVVALPPSSKTLASSDFCPFYMVQHGASMLGIQGHPEFTKPYSADLMELRRGVIPDERIEQGLESLRASVDGDLLAGWLVNFMRRFSHAPTALQSASPLP